MYNNMYRNIEAHGVHVQCTITCTKMYMYNNVAHCEINTLVVPQVLNLKIGLKYAPQIISIITYAV